VAEWTQRLEPILQQQEEAGQFDIHAYCEQFLEEVDEAVALHEDEAGSCDDDDDARVMHESGVSFGEVVSGKPSGEVCRIFLACLQLVNHGNIAITPAAGVDQWTFAAPVAAALERTARLSVEGRSAAVDPFMVKVVTGSRGAAHDANDVENFRAPSVQDKSGVPKKSALKSVGKGKNKGVKRVNMDMPSNIFISI
jgi:hypothetical protein